MNPIDDRLSAYLDDELDPVERAVIEAELDASAELRAELEAVGEVRHLLRNLEPVEVPSDFVFAPSSEQRWSVDGGGSSAARSLPEDAEPDRSAGAENVVSLASRRRGRRVFTRSVVAVAAAFALLVGIGSAIPGTEIVPAVDNLVSVHTAAAESLPMPMPESDMADMMKMGPDSDTMPMMGASEADDYLHLVYGSPDEYVSVFRQEGHLDESRLDESTPMEMDDGSTAYQLYSDDLIVLVVEADGLVYTIVTGDKMMDDAMKMTDTLPDDDDGIVENAFENLFGRF